MTKARVVIFDLDGTLIDSSVDLAGAANAARSARGLPDLTVPEVCTHVGNGVERLVAGVLGSEEGLGEGLEVFRTHYAAHALDHTDLYPGIRDMLDGIPFRRRAVLSNKPEMFCRRILEHLGLVEEFVTVMGGDTLAVRKPDPATLHHCLSALGATPEEALMVGDGIQDIRVGHAAGVATCGVLWGMTPRDELVAENPTRLIESPREVLELFDAPA